MLRLDRATLIALSVALNTASVGAGTVAVALVDKESLVTVSVPSGPAPTSAHPFANVVVNFGRTSNGAPARPETFRARLNGHLISQLFALMVKDGVVVGARARVEAGFLRLGRSGVNRLHLSIRSAPQPLGGRRVRSYRDTDRVVFHAETRSNSGPTAQATVTRDVILPGSPIQFDGGQSVDPDRDELSYHWDFGDGVTLDDPAPTHTYSDNADRVVTLTVSDGQAEGRTSMTLHGIPSCDSGSPPGQLRVDADQALEFGGVDLGQSATRTVIVRNLDSTPGTQVKIASSSGDPAFVLAPTSVTLGAGESLPISITFSPVTAGHQTARVYLAACAANDAQITLLAHGYGGAAPGAGPTLAVHPAFFLGRTTTGGLGIIGVRPSGDRFEADLSALWCATPDGGGSHDVCFRSADCANRGEQCVVPSSVGANQLNAVDFCGDAAGDLFVLSDTGSSGTSQNGDLVGSLVRFSFDEAGRRTGQALLRRVTDGTTHIACDARPRASGVVYLAEWHALGANAAAACSRDGSEALIGVSKADGSVVPTGDIGQIDANEVPPLDSCRDDLDPVQQLGVTPDGTAVYFEPDNNGVYRLRPAAVAMLAGAQAPFQVRSDGSVLYAAVTDSGTASTVRLYDVFPEQALQGALSIDQLTACASYVLPNNRPATDPRPALSVVALAADQESLGDGIVLVNVGVGTAAGPLVPPLSIQATVAFAVSANGPTCTPLGVVNLERTDSLSF